MADGSGSTPRGGGGIGYPAGINEVTEIASLLRRADVYTAKLSSRRRRDAMPADQAGREMFMQEPGHPMTVALAKEFGLYPPGCYVGLTNGEMKMGVVIKRGDTVGSPIVAALFSQSGVKHAEPVWRDTSIRSYQVLSVVPETGWTGAATQEQLMALMIRT